MVRRVSGRSETVPSFQVPDFSYGPAMSLLERFLDPAVVSLKICGVTTRDDADRLAMIGVDALGVNFWPMSKRYLPPEDAVWLRDLDGRILRVGVFVNEPPELPLRLVSEGLLDVVQLHGDETPEDAAAFREAGIPFIKAIGVKTRADLLRGDRFRSGRDPARCPRAGNLRRDRRGVRLGGRVGFPQAASGTARHSGRRHRARERRPRGHERPARRARHRLGRGDFARHQGL